jgi:glycosyltransferase involved in cell wall biosynthesis
VESRILKIHDPHLNHREGWNILRRWFVLGIPFFLIEAIYPKLFRHVTALSEWTRRKIKKPDAVVVPAGISSSIIAEGQETKEGDYILYVGRLHIKNKGLDTLFAAIRDQQWATLKLVGRGPDEARLKGMGLKNADFLGFLEEGQKIEMLRNSMFLVLPSRFEGWGIVVLEAAACGKPVVVSDIPELSFATQAGFGVSFRTGDPDDLREKIDYLMKSDDARREMGRKALEYSKGFTWESIAIDYETMLMEISRK